MNANIFEAGMTPENYVSVLRNYRSFVRNLMGEATARGEHVSALKTAAAGAPQPVRAILMTEDWCGDSACNLPVLTSLCGEAGIPFRIVRGSEHPQINDHYNNMGVDHIPVFSLWDGEFNELARWVEAPVAVTVKKDAWKAGRPEFMDLFERRNESKEAAKQFATLYSEFLEVMKSWYMADMWDETTREVIAAIQA